MSSPSRYNFGLIGQNISYSKSKDIFETIFKTHDLQGSFKNFDFPPDQFAARIKELKESSLAGFSVTIPYKEKIIEHLDRLDKPAKNNHAVNSVKIEDGKLLGFNTDSVGFNYGLKRLKLSFAEHRCVIFGTGGAASAVVSSLYDEFDCRDFIIVGRNQKNLNTFNSRLKQNFLSINMKTISFEETNDIQRENKNLLLVNCTPLGGANYLERLPLSADFKFDKNDIYYDLNYNSDNKMIKIVDEAKATAIDGSHMLVAQAVESLRLWTGIKAEPDEIHSKIFGPG